MPRYVALLRGVSPMNAKMGDLKRAFEAAGFRNVRTVLGSGNVVFDARPTSEDGLAQKAMRAMEKHLGRSFPTLVRPARALEELIASDPFARHPLPARGKRVVTFLRKPHGKLTLPIESDGVRILASTGREVFTDYVPNPRGPVFMALIEKTFGKDVTTRTWATVTKCAKA